MGVYENLIKRVNYIENEQIKEKEMFKTINNEFERPDFPKLMISKVTEAIVLMTEVRNGKGVGVILEKGELEDEINGNICTDWNINLFEDFNGEITLSNE